MNTTTRRRAVLYLRLSVSDDASTSIMRQEADLRELAEREGWDVVAILTDDGISGRKVRANATEALRLLREGEVDVLAVWKLDRWSRQGLGAIGDLVSTLDATPGALFIAYRDGIRSDQAAWRLTAAVLSEVARTEAENTATRVSAAFRAGKLGGRFTGGTIPYAYRPIKNPAAVGRMLVPVPAEAAEVRQAAARILRGDRVYSVVCDLNARRVPTARSPYRRAQLLQGVTDETLSRGTWTSTILQSILTSDNLLGRVSHRGKLIVGADGLPICFWEPVLDLEALVRLRARINNPKDTTEPRRPQRRRQARLLSGVVYCAHCDSKMYVNTSGGKPVFACPQYGKGCQYGPRMDAETVEKVVLGRFVLLAGQAPELDEVAAPADPSSVSALLEVEDALRQATVDLLAAEGDSPEIFGRISILKSRRAELRSTISTPTNVSAPTGRTLGEALLSEMHDDARRRVLSGAIEFVKVWRLADGVGRKGFHPERVEIVWIS